MGERTVDLNFLKDLHSSGYIFTVGYIFNFLKDEIREGKKVHLEKKEGTKKHKTTIQSAPELDNFYLTHFKAASTDIFPSNET